MQPEELDALSVGDAPELTLYILRAFVDGEPPEVVRSELQRYLWNQARFGYAVPLERARKFIAADKAGDFVYHQRTQLMFTGVSAHPILMSHLAALHKTDFSARLTSWDTEDFYPWDATSKLSDDFIEGGLGFYKSRVGGGSITVSREFAWTAQEKRVFGSFQRKYL
jgi:hypothetical protein